MADMVIEVVDPFDEPLLHEWWATAHAAHAERPYDLGLSWEFSRASLRRPNPERETVLLAAFDGGDEDQRLVGAASGPGCSPRSRRVLVGPDAATCCPDRMGYRVVEDLLDLQKAL